jgi:phosphomethylpyrimidine synthase
MKISQEVRQYAKDNDLTDEQRAIEAGFKEQSARFREEGSIIYKQI